MTVKAGQKCTSVRRILVPENLVEDVQIALGKRLAKTIVGDPSVEGVRMGALAGMSQVEEVKETLATGIHTADTKPVFTAADYWNLERSRKVRNGRRFLLA